MNIRIHRKVTLLYLSIYLSIYFLTKYNGLSFVLWSKLEQVPDIWIYWKVIILYLSIYISISCTYTHLSIYLSIYLLTKYNRLSSVLWNKLEQVPDIRIYWKVVIFTGIIKSFSVLHNIIFIIILKQVSSYVKMQMLKPFIINDKESIHFPTANLYWTEGMWKKNS